jgi:hypothetical protein
MGTFTIPLKQVIALTGGTVTLDPDTGISTLVGGNIGLDYYPIFDETYRNDLTGKIVDHYWNREIGMETIEMFQLAMRRKMNEIMPYYNKLYESEKIEFDPLSTVDLTTISTMNSDEHADGDTTQTGTSASRSVSSETPQTMLQPNADYASSAADSNSVSSTNGVSTQDTTNDVDTNSNTKGYQGVAADLLMRYREALLNIDVMIINELEEMFMLVWDNGDEYMDNNVSYPSLSYYGTNPGW